MSEFTGERVIPGEVEIDLWAEHAARYAFASRLAAGKRVLDLGCGSGYGTAELAAVASEGTGVDNAADAVAYASSHYPQARFLQHSATDLPFSDASFDLITAFELIEHLEDWPRLLAEARRLLTPAGLFIVSTPNKLYYAEARGASGPNPFHQHEFEYAEFRAALEAVFPHVRILLQDRLESFAFYDADATAAGADARLHAGKSKPEDANFFVALCSAAELPPTPAFVFVPEAANLLRERERHIRLLETELAQVRTWLEETTASRDQLLSEHEILKGHLEAQNQWGRRLETDLHAAQDRIKAADEEQKRAAEVIAGLNEENRAKTEWALETERRLTAELAERAAQLEEANQLLDRAEATVVERTEWAQRLDAQVQSLEQRVEMARQSRWLRLGRKAGLGPEL